MVYCFICDKAGHDTDLCSTLAAWLEEEGKSSPKKQETTCLVFFMLSGVKPLDISRVLAMFNSYGVVKRISLHIAKGHPSGKVEYLTEIQAERAVKGLFGLRLNSGDYLFTRLLDPTFSASFRHVNDAWNWNLDLAIKSEDYVYISRPTLRNVRRKRSSLPVRKVSEEDNTTENDSVTLPLKDKLDPTCKPFSPKKEHDENIESGNQVAESQLTIDRSSSEDITAVTNKMIVVMEEARCDFKKLEDIQGNTNCEELELEVEAYLVVQQTGAEHNPTFFTRCFVGDFSTKAQANSKNVSKVQAARQMSKLLGQQPSKNSITKKKDLEKLTRKSVTSVLKQHLSDLSNEIDEFSRKKKMHFNSGRISVVNEKLKDFLNMDDEQCSTKQTNGWWFKPSCPTPDPRWPPLQQLMFGPVPSHVKWSELRSSLLSQGAVHHCFLQTNVSKLRSGYVVFTEAEARQQLLTVGHIRVGNTKIPVKKMDGNRIPQEER